VKDRHPSGLAVGMQWLPKRDRVFRQSRVGGSKRFGGSDVVSLGWMGLFSWCEKRLGGSPRFRWRHRKIKGPKVAVTTFGPDTKEVSYEQALGIGSSRSRNRCLRLEDDGRDQFLDPNPAAIEVAGSLAVTTPAGL